MIFLTFTVHHLKIFLFKTKLHQLIKSNVLQIEEGIQPLEAMLYTVNQINRDPNILPGIRLGILAFDSCDNPNYALEQALNFVKGLYLYQN